MKPSEMPRFAELITAALAYYRQDTSAFVAQVWWNACQNFEYEQVSKALSAHIGDAERGQFAPKVSDIVRILSGTHTDRALLAWGKVLMATSAVGAYRDVVFDDAAIHAAVMDCGGWVKLCRTSLDELSFLQHRFCGAHKAYTGRGEFDYPRQLGGDRSPDSEFARRGLPPPTPAVVGNVERARLVFYSGGNTVAQITFKPLQALVAKRLEAA